MKKYPMFKAMLQSCASIDDVLKVYDCFIKPGYSFNEEVSDQGLLDLLAVMYAKIEELIVAKTLPF